MPRRLLDRRSFLRTTAAAAALAAGTAATAVGALPAAAAGSGNRLIPRPAIGMHLYTMRRSLAVDFAGTVQALADIGYATVGVSGRHGHSAAAIRTMLDDAGLDAVLEHVGYDRLTNNLEGACEDVLTLGGHWVVTSSLPGSLYTLDGIRQAAANFNRAGEVAASYGLKVLHHNHDAEFRTDSGRVLYDVLLEETDPDLVGYELDVYWAARGGYDAGDYFVEHPARFPALHVKDMAPSGGFADVGSGILDFAAMFEHAHRGGVRQFLVEHDNPADELATARNSFRHLRDLRF
ncbi:sugar phosphate isomerase/epimerase family protein [Jiangella mangrovi]|uniref:Sugar phosphate isomerase/epimerase n=1 Tax=Jiangella mangrovi TaxID=1524084 RepID=A0A7W9LN51_9ACTN|nr:sugar phosphate isomerase/epimerase [Jiangella mangrovi]MBB5789777.1 sugar phosphate isomerase/epimerase [Jiangella mangrovi]